MVSVSRRFRCWDNLVKSVSLKQKRLHSLSSRFQHYKLSPACKLFVLFGPDMTFSTYRVTHIVSEWQTFQCSIFTGAPPYACLCISADKRPTITCISFYFWDAVHVILVLWALSSVLEKRKWSRVCGEQRQCWKGEMDLLKRKRSNYKEAD